MTKYKVSFFKSLDGFSQRQGLIILAGERRVLFSSFCVLFRRKEKKKHCNISLGTCQTQVSGFQNFEQLHPRNLFIVCCFAKLHALISYGKKIRCTSYKKKALFKPKLGECMSEKLIACF